MRATINHYYWTSDSPWKNVGDCVTQFLLEAMGFNVKLHTSNLPGDVFRGASTLPSEGCVTGVVWGSGYSGNSVDYRGLKADIFAVRGPLTRRLLQLPDCTPLGDPALLLPRLIASFQRVTPPIFVPHIHNIGKETPEGCNVVLPLIKNLSEFRDKIREITGSSFVLTNSLHAAIFAQAYGVRWALYLKKGHALNMPLKWDDWFEYLGLKMKSVSCLEEGIEWSEKVAGSIIQRSLAPLVQSFPYPIPNPITLSALLR